MPKYAYPYTKTELEALEQLKNHSIKETAQAMAKSHPEWKDDPEGNVRQILYRLRNKIDKYTLGVNIANNYKQSKRLGKLLRRQEV